MNFNLSFNIGCHSVLDLSLKRGAPSTSFHTHHHTLRLRWPPLHSSPWRFASNNYVNSYANLISRSDAVAFFYHANGLKIKRGISYCAFDHGNSTSSSDPLMHIHNIADKDKEHDRRTDKHQQEHLLMKKSRRCHSLAGYLYIQNYWLLLCLVVRNSRMRERWVVQEKFLVCYHTLLWILDSHLWFFRIGFIGCVRVALGCWSLFCAVFATLIRVYLAFSTLRDLRDRSTQQHRGCAFNNNALPSPLTENNSKPLEKNNLSQNYHTRRHQRLKCGHQSNNILLYSPFSPLFRYTFFEIPSHYFSDL